MTIVLIFSKAAGSVTTGETIDGHLSHGWQVAGADYLRLDVEAPARVTWEGHAGSPATSGHFSCVNGVAYIDRRILAFVDRERADGYLLREDHHCAALVVQPL